MTLIKIRDEKVCGVGPWAWPEKDYKGFQCPADEFPELRDLVLGRTPERHMIVQAGGCCGMYPRLWAEYFEVVYTFEPDHFNFFCLVANCTSERIIKMQAALGEKPGLCAVEKGPDFNVGMHRIAKTPGNVPILRLDDFIFERLSAIQLDCEGYEDRIILGARETINRHRPTLAIEDPCETLRVTLDEMGYKEVAQCGSAPPDFIFVPSERETMP